MPSAKPLYRAFTQESKDNIVKVQDWLTNLISVETAQHFTRILDTTLTDLCQSIAEAIATKSPLHPDENASLAYSRPAYLKVFTTQKKRARRSSSGTYRIYYDLTDADSDGQADTLRVLAVRHAAERPIWPPEDD